MAKLSIKEFKNIHVNQDIWLLGKGASLNYINKSFFDGKITIGVNDIDMWYETTYLMRKEFHPDGLKPEEILSRKTKLLLSEYKGCVQEWGLNEVGLENLLDKYDIWFFKTPFTHGELVMPDFEKGEEIPASLSSMAMAMCMAAYMGAKNIILCGNDECLLDGKDYVDGISPYICSSDHKYVLDWQASQSLPVRNMLRNSGYNIYSLHPFINVKELIDHYKG